MVDWKTSNSIDKIEYGAQPVAYGKAVELLSDKKIKIQDHIVVQVNKNRPEYKAFRVADPKLMWELFNKVLALYHEWERAEHQSTFEPLIKRNVIRLNGEEVEGLTEVV